MKPTQTLLSAFKLVGRYLRRDWLVVALFLVLLLGSEVISLYLLPQRSTVLPKASLPFWVTILQALIMIVQCVLVLAFFARINAWLADDVFLNARSTAQQAYRRLGTLIVILIALFIYYLGIPTVILTASLLIWPKWYPSGSPWPSLIFLPFSAYAAFGSVYTLPIMFKERSRGFQYVRESLKLSVGEARTTLLVATPGIVGNALRPIGAVLSWKNSTVSLIYQALLLVSLVLGFFVFAASKRLLAHEIDMTA
jgi:hypothetical protein